MSRHRWWECPCADCADDRRLFTGQPDADTIRQSVDEGLIDEDDAHHLRLTLIRGGKL